jgi:hypothetical protein
MVSAQEERPIRYEVSYDVREGLLSTLERIELGGLSFCQEWTKKDHPRHLWLVDYAQERESDNHADKYGHGGFFDRCTQERLSRLPENICRRIARFTLANAPSTSQDAPEHNARGLGHDDQDKPSETT